MAVPLRHPHFTVAGASLRMLTENTTPNLPFADIVMHLLNPNFAPIQGSYVLEHDFISCHIDDMDASELILSPFPAAKKGTRMATVVDRVVSSLEHWHNGTVLPTIENSPMAALRFHPGELLGTADPCDDAVGSAVPLPGSNGKTWFIAGKGFVSRIRVEFDDKQVKRGAEGKGVRLWKTNGNTMRTKSDEALGLHDVAVMPDHQRLVVTAVAEGNSTNELTEGLVILSAKDGTFLSWIPLCKAAPYSERCLNLPPVVNPFTGWVALGQSSPPGIWLCAAAQEGKATTIPPSKFFATPKPVRDVAWVGRGTLCAVISGALFEYDVTLRNEEEPKKFTMTVTRQLAVEHPGYSYGLTALSYENTAGSYSVLCLHTPVSGERLTGSIATIPKEKNAAAERSVKAVPLKNLDLAKFHERHTTMGWLR